MSRIPTVLAIIPARGGSKSLPRKNVLPVGGKPLIAWTVAAAFGAKCVSRVILSSDNDEIIEAARGLECDVPFRRPARLATDEATTVDVVLHALAEVPGYDYLVVLQPTSPLRTSADIDAAFALMRMRDANCCVSVCEAEQSPYWMYSLKGDDRLVSILSTLDGSSRRQVLPEIYVLNGALYIASCDWFRENRSFLVEGTVAYKMPTERSIDIDTAEDFETFRRIVE